jgi:ATP-binding cassette, subfamily B, bacterial MsbA
MTSKIWLGRELVPLARRLGLPLRVMAALVLLNLLWIGFEGLGVGLLLPIFELLRAGGDLASDKLSGRHWEIIRDVSAHLGIPVSLGLLLGISFGFLLLRQVFNYLNVLIYGITRRTTAEKIRRKAFHGFLRAQIAFQDETKIGEIANELTVELDRALASLFALMRTFGAGIQMLVYIGGLFLLSPAMTALSVSVFAVFGFLARGMMASVKQSGRAISEANAQLTAFVVERLQRARLIRLSGMEKAEGQALAKLSYRQLDQYVHQNLAASRITLLPEPIAIGFGYLALYFGARVFNLGLGELGLFMVVLIRLMPVVKDAIANYNNVVGRWPSVETVDRRLTAIAAMREPKGGDVVFEKLEQAISYDHVSFSYPEGAVPALRDVNVNLPAHRMTALVGPSGAGKSTFVDLLPRLREPSAGRIRFDGISIADFTTESLRAGIAYVPQQPQMFHSTVAEHIRYGKENAADKELREAARLAGALGFIEQLPRGFDTMLGEAGIRLSGGQRQRLDIARALVRRAPILILDEPTSALDADAEADFRNALRQLRVETRLTIVVIAHRLSTIADADQIVVLKNGRVDAVGTHDQLIVGGGWYARAYAQQSDALARESMGAA